MELYRKVLGHRKRKYKFFTDFDEMIVHLKEKRDEAAFWQFSPDPICSQIFPFIEILYGFHDLEVKEEHLKDIWVSSQIIEYYRLIKAIDRKIEWHANCKSDLCTLTGCTCIVDCWYIY